jgi:hypothetical protein
MMGGVLATYLAIATAAWGVQCPVRVEWIENVTAGNWPAQGITAYPRGTRLGAVTYPGGCHVYLSASWWRQRPNPRYRCDLMAHEVGHIALTGANIPPSLHHSLPGPMSEPVGRAFETCRKWYRTTEHFRHWRARRLALRNN